MKKTVTAILFSAACILFGCDPAATFDKPQPDGEEALTAFPERLQGRYLAADSASVLTIAGNRIIRNYDYDFKQHKDSIGKGNRLVGDTLVDTEDGTKDVVLIKGDSIVQHIHWADTLFNIQESNVLKKLKGYYFLNSRYGDSAWVVRKLWIDKGVLNVAAITNEGDIQKLKEITETTADTTSTHFSLTRQQFNQFVKQNGFGSLETFIRIEGSK